MKAIVFILRGCPSGWLGAYGNESVATPHLDQLASESVVFDRHISDCPEPDAACRSLIGTEPSLLDSLRVAGIRTILVCANREETDAPDWFYAAWGEVFDARPREADLSPLDALMQSFPALLDRLTETSDYLLWVEIDRLIPPWDVPQEVFEAYLREEAGEEDEEPIAKSQEDAEDDNEADDDQDGDDESDEVDDEPEEVTPLAVDDEPVVPWSDPPTGPFDPADPAEREWLYFSFASVVSRLDAELGFLFDTLRARGLDRSATWLVTSDFGLPLGEHGQIGLHRPWLHDELVHLPLFLRLPAAAEACRRVAGFTQPPDIPATLLDLFGLALPPRGQTLLPLARGDVESAREFATTVLELGPAAERAIRTPEWALLIPERVPDGETRSPKLFVKPDDRGEMNDLYSHNVDRAEELDAILQSWRAARG